MANDRAVVFDDDNPEWTEEDFARARPASEVLPPEMLAAWARFRAEQRERLMVEVRLPQTIADHYKAQGDDWQERIATVLEAQIAAERANAA